MRNESDLTADDEGRVAVVVLNRDRRDDLLACLTALQASAGAPIRTVVVDNGSSDGSIEAVERQFPDVDLLAQGRNLGVAGGRNVGARHAAKAFAHEFILFLDNDTVVDDRFIARLRDALKADPKSVVACGKAHLDSLGTQLMSAGISANLYTGVIGDRGAGAQDQGQYDAPQHVDACGGFAMMIRRDVFWQFGGFDEIFNPYGWEDVDFCLRARRHGYRTTYRPEATLWHKGSRLGRAPVPNYERTKIRNYVRLVIRHANPVQLLACMVVVPVRWLWLASQLVRQGHLRAVGAHLQGVMETVRGRP